jgi:predicted RNase H-like nuclease (RuvC/YqgF family)
MQVNHASDLYKNYLSPIQRIRSFILTLFLLYGLLHMSDLKEIVGSLENKVSKLVNYLEGLKKDKSTLNNELLSMSEAHEKALSTATYWEEKYNALKLAQSMLGSDQNTTEAKLKINTLIKELDYCIVALSK